MFDQLFKLLVMGHARAASFAPVEQASGDIKQIGMNIINYAFIIGGGLAVIYIIYAGFTYMTAGSDQAKVDQAKNTIMYAIIGLVIITLSFVILNWVNTSVEYISVPSTNITPNL